MTMENKNQQYSNRIVLLSGFRLFVIGTLTVLLFNSITESIEQENLRRVQNQQENSIREIAENGYTKENAAIDFEMRDGQIYEIKINIEALKETTEENESRIEKLEKKTFSELN